MTFLELAESRYSVRKFLPEHLSEELIQTILKAGLLAPTGCNNQPFRILVLNEGESIEKLKGCTRCHFDAPTAMLVCAHTNECWTRKYDGKTSGVVDASIVTTHLMLEAWELGIGSCWVMHFDPAAMRETFAIPQALEPVALLVMGYPAPDAAPAPLHFDSRSAETLVVREHF